MERLKGSGNALSKFPAAGHPKNLVPSPRNDNRMDECALDLLSPPNFPVLQENFLLRARISRSCFFPSFFESSSRYSLSSRSWISRSLYLEHVCSSIDEPMGRKKAENGGIPRNGSESKERESRRESETRRDVGRFRNDITTRVKWRGKLAQLLMDIAEKARQVLPEAGDRGGGGETRPIREKFSSRRIASRAVSRFVAKP